MDKPLKELRTMEVYLEFRSEIEKFLDCDYRTIFIRHQNIPPEKKDFLIAIRVGDYFLKPKSKEFKKRVEEISQRLPM